MNIAFQSAVIFVQDIEVSRQFYEGLLGQQVLMDHGPNVGFAGGFAIWQVDHARQIIGQQPPGEQGQLGHNNLELYFETEDLETALAQLVDANVPFVHPLREQPWGQRVFRFYDPDGHVVEIGEPISATIRRLLEQGLSPEQVAQRSSMSLEIVNQVAESMGGA
jgi:catechol 2,3-dioxygenase-like lactoylglutathione lyase family enzyme